MGIKGPSSGCYCPEHVLLMPASASRLERDEVLIFGYGGPDRTFYPGTAVRRCLYVVVEPGPAGMQTALSSGNG